MINQAADVKLCTEVLLWATGAALSKKLKSLEGMHSIGNYTYRRSLGLPPNTTEQLIRLIPAQSYKNRFRVDVETTVEALSSPRNEVSSDNSITRAKQDQKEVLDVLLNVEENYLKQKASKRASTTVCPVCGRPMSDTYRSVAFCEQCELELEQGKKEK